MTVPTRGERNEPQHATTTTRTTRRSQKSSLNPYYLDDATFTMADIFHARTIDVTSASK